MDRTHNQRALLRSTVEQFRDETADREAQEAAMLMLSTLDDKCDVSSDGTRIVTSTRKVAYRVGAYQLQLNWLGAQTWFVKVNCIGQPWFQELHHPAVTGYPPAVTQAITDAFNDASSKGLYPR